MTRVNVERTVYTVVGCYTEVSNGWAPADLGFVEYVLACAAWEAEERSLDGRSDDAVVLAVFEGRIEPEFGVVPLDTTEDEGE